MVASTATLFYRQWVFVETAVLSNDSIILNFSPDPEAAGPFEMRIVRKSNSTKTRVVKNFYARGRVPIGFESDVWEYDTEIYLDDHLAFAGSYGGADEIPF